MKKYVTFLIITMTFFACKETSKNARENEVISTVSSEEEWIDLFDGGSLEHWQAYLGGSVPKYWSIKEDALVFTPPSPEERKADGTKTHSSFNIVTKENYSSFVLSLEWKISKGGNSGIFWGVHENEKFAEPYQTGLEIQVLDNENHPDAKNGTSHRAGALYDLVPPVKDVTKPVGEWNTCVITINHKTNKGSCVLNGVKIASFPVNGSELNALLKESKFKDWEGFGTYRTGKIGLQDHNDMVSYRNLKIRKL